MCHSSLLLFVYLLYQSKLLAVHASACIMFVQCLHPSVHTVRLHGCACERSMCVSVCVCLDVGERGTTREGEREMRGVWKLNGQTLRPDVLVHAVSLASFSNFTGFFKLLLLLVFVLLCFTFS